MTDDLVAVGREAWVRSAVGLLVLALVLFVPAGSLRFWRVGLRLRVRLGFGRDQHLFSQTRSQAHRTPHACRARRRAGTRAENHHDNNSRRVLATSRRAGL